MRQALRLVSRLASFIANFWVIHGAAVNPRVGLAAGVRDLATRAPGLSTAERRWELVTGPVQLIADPLRHREMPTM